ncbi:hypothetical protein Tco_1354718 [Tanacetum coccineum]
MEEVYKPSVLKSEKGKPKIHESYQKVRLKKTPDAGLITTSLTALGKLNEATLNKTTSIAIMEHNARKGLAGNEFTYCFPMASRVISNPIDPKRSRKTTHMPILREHLPIVACLLGYAMLWAVPKNV